MLAKRKEEQAPPKRFKTDRRAVECRRASEVSRNPLCCEETSSASSLTAFVASSLSGVAGGGAGAAGSLQVCLLTTVRFAWLLRCFQTEGQGLTLKIQKFINKL